MAAATTQLAPCYRVQSKSYGFRLPRSQWFEHQRNSMRLAGMELPLTDQSYVRIDGPGRSFFFGSEHSGAFFFMVEAYRDGLVHGNERFAHLDLADHPDNSLLDKKFTLSPEKGSLNQQFDRDAIRMMDRGYVNSANYVTALSRTFPEMRFEFLHTNERVGGPNHYRGMAFDGIGSIFEENKALPANSIVSIDLDIFTYSKMPLAPRELMEKLVWLTRQSKVVMAFASPGWIELKQANDLASQLAERMMRAQAA
jgi:hypothetical protein